MTAHKKKGLAILGATGSIGESTLRVAAALKDDFEVVALSASRNVQRLARQMRTFRPRIAAVEDEVSAKKLKSLVSSRAMRVVVGPQGLAEIVSRADVEVVMFAISGVACLNPLLKAIDKKKHIALANKEAIVAAGEIIMRRASEKGVRIIPVDSEHSAIFQCLEGNKRQFLKKIFLTSSGGPLHNIGSAHFDGLSRSFILKHPRWKMGRKISVDSATLMNKGLEVIEARWLFDVPQKNIEVIVHPEAIVHSMVEFLDGSILAEIAPPDMKLPIQYALTYPERKPGMVRGVNFSKVKAFTFYRPSFDRFPCLSLARASLKGGKTFPAVLNAADEEAVRRYLDGKIPFSGIPRTIEAVLERHRPARGRISLADIINADRWAREEVYRRCQ